MIGETSPTEPASAEARSAPKAFVSLFIAGARADGSVSPHEANPFAVAVD